jgi:hypothetical protein
MKTRIEATLFCVVLALLLAAPAAADELLVPISKVPPAEVLGALDKALWDYHVFEMDLAAVDAAVRRDGRLSLYLANQRLDLELEENSLRAEGYRRVLLSADGQRELDPGPVVTFKGRVVGDVESDVRITVTPSLFTGSIRTGGETVFIDPLADFLDGFADKAALSSHVVVYRDHAVKEIEGAACGTEAVHDKRAELAGLRGRVFGDLVKGPVDKAHQFRTLEVATDCDGEYYGDYGNPGAYNRIEGILNDVEGFIYTSELNLGINVVFQQCWTNPSSDPSSASTTLNQMRSWWISNRGNIARDNAHLFSGKNFSGGTIGIAWVGVICTAPSFAYGISQDISGTAARRRLTAHEIGHNLSAGHDNQAPVCSGVNCNGNGPIMCSFVQTGSSSAADDFSSCSFNDIDDHIDSFGGCI